MASARSDKALARGLAAGDESALAELYDTYADEAFSLAYRLLGNRHEAEDLVQEMFVGLLRNPQGYRGDAKFSTWMYRVILNRTRNVFRKKARDRERIRQLGEMEPHRQGTPQDERDERARHLQKAVETLPEAQREVLILTKYHNRSYEEVGAIVGASPNAVKMRVSRAIQELRRLLTKNEAD